MQLAIREKWMSNLEAMQPRKMLTDANHDDGDVVRVDGACPKFIHTLKLVVSPMALQKC
jgi:hypothetical protein